MKYTPKHINNIKCIVEGMESGCPIWSTEKDEDCFKLEKEQPKDCKPKKRLIDQVKGAFIIDHFLTKDECQRLIESGQQFNFEEAKVSVGGNRMVSAPSYRNNKRVIFQAKSTIMDRLYTRLKPFLVKNELDGFVMYGLNNRLRFYSYEKGNFFRKHYDGCYAKSSSDVSLYTLLIYLNNVDENHGGCTTFYSRNQKVVYEYVPQQGAAVLFPHGAHPLSPLHDGALLTGGHKFVLRSDVMYKK
mmetsp:Transcript_3454/g.5088  ORF Transcript_3454/g.5088 Transcript_3454/m.5088 type:complete len:244 (+) Transcript_3454:64-795(+)